MTGQAHGEKNLTGAIKYKSTKPGSGNTFMLGGFRSVTVFVLCSYFPQDVYCSHLELSLFTPIPTKPMSDTLQIKFKEEETEEK